MNESFNFVEMLAEATQIVGFFDKWDEQKRVKRDIKRVVIAEFDESLVKPVTERFMELAEVEVQVMEGFDFPVEVIRVSRKRSAAIHVSAGVSVRVPQSLSISGSKTLFRRGRYGSSGQD